MKYHSVNVLTGRSALSDSPIEIKTLMIKPIITTEKMWPVYIQTTAILLRRLSLVIISLSCVVKPAPVNNEATWNLILLVAKPVSLKATEKNSIIIR